MTEFYLAICGNGKSFAGITCRKWKVLLIRVIRVVKVLLTIPSIRGKCLELDFKVTLTTFWLKCTNLSKCTKFFSTDKLEVADKYVGHFTKNYLMGWQIRGLKDGIPGNIWVVYWNL